MDRDTQGKITTKEVWFWLCNLPGIGMAKIKKLLAYYSSPFEVYSSTEEELINLPFLSPADRSTILLERNIDSIRAKLLELKRKGIAFYSCEAPSYPKRLLHIYDPPYGLYGIGTLPDPNKLTIAIIGTRNCSAYGREVARYFSMELAKAGVQIISGMARGVDSYGHMGAMQANGYTLAVLGSGIDYCYPPENIELYMRLEKEGGILSEYGPGVVPRAGHFPLRNRIISGLSDGILVVEAKTKSGSLITADQGLDQGKDIFAIPGRIKDVLSQGTNQLIKYGAQIVTCPEDILTYYKYESNGQLMKEEPKVYLSDSEQRIINELSLEPVHIGTLSVATGMDMGELMQGMLQLEIKHMIAQTTKNYYIRVLPQK